MEPGAGRIVAIAGFAAPFYVKKHMLGCFRCYLPEAQRLYAEKEDYT